MSRIAQLRHALGVRLADRLNPKARSDFDAAFIEDLERCLPFTMTSPERLHGVREAVEYVVREGVPGELVECGVWRGGSSMLAAITLRRMRSHERRLWLYDTFAGMTEPTREDGAAARERWQGSLAADHSEWCYASLDDVRRNVLSTGVRPDRFEFVAGPVEETIPAHVPGSIAVLRLDTDFYSSTRHELEHLWPRLSPGGVLILDDYGHWGGARRAVDEFFDALGHRPLLSRLDYTARMGVKAATALAGRSS